MTRFALAVSALALSLTPALAQTSSTSKASGLVNVNLQNVLNNLAADIKIDRTNIPVNAQIPIDIAANVCGVSVNVLSSQAQSGQASCTAKTGSPQLTQAVQQQMSAGGNATSGTSAAGASTGGSRTGSAATGTAPSGSRSGATAPASGTANQGAAPSGSSASSGTAPAGSTNQGTTASGTGRGGTEKPGGTTGSTTGGTSGGSQSARDLAPGRSGNTPPGHTDNPRQNAPGQMKKE